MFRSNASVGQGKDTEASEWIIRVVDRPDPRPVWVVIWGGSADLAQALWRVRRDRTPRGTQPLRIARLRVHAIGDQDSTGPWIREQFPGLFMITQRRAYRGMYRGGDASLVSSEWVEMTHPRARGARRPLPQLSGRRHLVGHARSGAGDQGGGHAVVPLAGPQRAV